MEETRRRMEGDVLISSTDRPSVVNVTCEALTKEGRSCRRKVVLGMGCCRRHLKWEGECSICLEEFPNRELKCGHRFHRKCFERWKRTVREKGEDVTCPLCRSVESKNMTKVQGSLAFEGIEAISNMLQMLLPFPAQMIEQMAESLWNRLEE
jgi:hypothetical protein